MWWMLIKPAAAVGAARVERRSAWAAARTGWKARREAEDGRLRGWLGDLFRGRAGWEYHSSLLGSRFLLPKNGCQ